MRDAVSFYNSAIRGFPAITDFAVSLSKVLLAHPGVRLTQLSWQATDDPKATPAMLPMQTRVSPPVRALPKAAPAAGSQSESGPNAPFSAGKYEIAHVEATVRSPQNDFRGALEQVERLAADISRVDGFRAEVLESPLDVSSSTALQGRFGEKDPGQMETRFVLRIVRERRKDA